MKRRHAFILAAVLMVLAGCNSSSWSSGDRVLVAKCLYESKITPPKRFDVVVFKYPRGPVENGSPKNYIKRLLGLPGQILAIFFGQLFWWEPGSGQPLPYEEDLKDPHIDPNDLWKKDFMHVDDKASHDRFERGEFKIVRKPPKVMMDLRRIVYDNDFHASDLGPEYLRWKPRGKTSWKGENDYRDFRHPGGTDKSIDWIRYQHLLRNNKGPEGDEVKPRLITDFEAYNNYAVHREGMLRSENPNWVGDLMLECQVTVDKAEGSFFMELSKGINRFRARFDLDKGTCTLFRQGPVDRKIGKWEEMASKPTTLKNPGSYHLCFANFDSRLTVWVNRDLPFGDGQEYPSPEMPAKGEKPGEAEKRRGPTKNDLEPASIGSQGAAVHVRAIRLWRDTYYTLTAGSSDDSRMSDDDWANPDSWNQLRKLTYRTMYVQPGHYLCLGDNSPFSSDGRDWGLVPERLMLGRALMVYFPFDRAGPIR